MNIYARWDPPEIHFYNGSELHSSIPLTEGVGKSLAYIGKSLPTDPQAKPWQTDLIGWYPNADGSGEEFTTNTIIPYSMAVYAIWGVVPLPGEPGSVTVDTDDDTITVTWTEPTDGGEADEYEIIITDEDDNEIVITIVKDGDGWKAADDEGNEYDVIYNDGDDTFTIIIDDMEDGTYRVRVRAKNRGGENESTEVTVVVDSEHEDDCDCDDCEDARRHEDSCDCDDCEEARRHEDNCDCDDCEEARNNNNNGGNGRNRGRGNGQSTGIVVEIEDDDIIIKFDDDDAESIEIIVTDEDGKDTVITIGIEEDGERTIIITYDDGSGYAYRAIADDYGNYSATFSSPRGATYTTSAGRNGSGGSEYTVTVSGLEDGEYGVRVRAYHEEEAEEDEILAISNFTAPRVGPRNGASSANSEELSGSSLNPILLSFSAIPLFLILLLILKKKRNEAAEDNEAI